MSRSAFLALALWSCAFLAPAAARPARAEPPATAQVPAAQPAAPAPAQPDPAAQPTRAATLKPSEVRPFDDWSMRCFAVQTTAPCDVFEMVVQRYSKQRILSVSIAYSPPDNTYIAQFVMPWGVKLAAGLTIVAGPYHSKPLAFRHCSVEGCFVEGRLDSATVDALAGPIAKATLSVIAEDGRRLDLPLSLKGFSAALDAMKAAAQSKSR